MKRKILFVFTFVLSALGFVMAVNAETATTLPADQDGKITLDQDVALTREFKVTTGQDITIDLAGHTLTGPAVNEDAYDGYAINNYYGTLKIIDSGSTKGKIVCPSNDSSCVRNYGTLEVDGVTIESDFIAIKNEEASTLTVKNSNISSGEDSVSIENYGTATINDSKINATTGIAIFAMTYNDYSSTTTIKDCVIDATRAIVSWYDGSKSESASSQIIVNGGTFSSNATIELKEDGTASSLNINGEVTGPAAILPYAQKDSTIILNQKVENVTVPQGVTVRTINGLNVVENEDGTISVVAKVDETSQTTTTQAPEKNANTADNAGLYFLLALAGLGVVGLTTKSLVKHH